MGKILAKIRDTWNSLPHPVQAMLCFAATTAGTTFVHAVSEGNCFSFACMKHYALTSLAAGAVVVKAFYMTPNRVLSQTQAPSNGSTPQV